MLMTDPVSLATEALDSAQEKLREARTALADGPFAVRSQAVLDAVRDLESDLAGAVVSDPLNPTRQIRSVLPLNDQQPWSVALVSDAARIPVGQCLEELRRMEANGDARKWMRYGDETWTLP